MAQDGQEDFIPSIQEIPAMPREDFIPQREEPPAPPTTTLNYYTPEEAFTRFSQYLPIEATPNDLLVPSDDPRVYTYQMANGNIYQVPAYQEVLAERRTIGEAFRHAVDQIPSRTEVEEGLLNLPSALYGSIENMVQGRGTYEDVIGTATGMLGANVVPRSRFVDEILEDQPNREPEVDFWEDVDIDDSVLDDLEFEPLEEPMPPARPQDDMFEQVPFNPDEQEANLLNRLIAQEEANPVEMDWDLPNIRDPSAPPTSADPGRMWQPPPVPLREGKKPNSGVVPLYPPRDYEMPEYTPENTIVFRSPVRDLVAGMQIPSQGIKGSQFIKMLNDNPSIRNSEVSSLELGISPEARYTREELQQLVDGRVFQVEATVMPHSLNQDEFYTLQRQPVRDTEADYAEIVITATPEEGGRDFRANSQHFDDNTLAHTRVSLRTPESVEGSPYILVEEMQSDLVQRGWESPTDRKKLQDMTFIEWQEQQYPNMYSDQFYKDQLTEYETNLLPVVERLDAARRRIADGNGLFEGGMALESVVRHVYGNLPEELKNNPLYDLPSLRTILADYVDYTSTKNTQRNQVVAPPIRNTQESTRLLVESLISYADRMGADEIVFPPLERIAAERFSPGTKDYEKALTPGSGFHQTYVSSLKKVIQELQQEFGSENLPVYSREINYPPQRSLNITPEIMRRDWEALDSLRNEFHTLYPQDTAQEIDVRLSNRLSEMRNNEMSALEYYRANYGWEFIDNRIPFDTLSRLREVEGVPQEPILPTQGIAINIGALRDQYNLQYPRFSDGGLVTQTRSAFGGMK
jgi:hypothetical protein